MLKKELHGTNMETETIIIHKHYHANKPDFMTKERLAEELCCSPEYIDKMVRTGTLKEEVHFTKESKRFLRFYYPAVKEMLAPARFTE
ncbi:hypothetical protein ADMFC3_26680 [Geovibrio sp. ADMFC3]|jgi:hypothetical protein